jgi:adenylosuccinate synthase
MSAWLADKHSVAHISSSNFPNAGHTAVFLDGTKFVAKALPTAAILKRTLGMRMWCFLSPGSGFSWERLYQEWIETNKPEVFIHDRACIVNESHAQREREDNGKDCTKHIASTMQGSAAAMSDKIMRRPESSLVRSVQQSSLFKAITDIDDFLESVRVLDGMEFRNLTHNLLAQDYTLLHEGSQGYALSIDHGSHYPYCTGRNCTLQAAMDQMAIPPSMVGDVYLNLRTFPIRVGNVVEGGMQKGYSGDFYPDCKETTWEQVAQDCGMPPSEKAILAERERTTVTKRIRRVTNFSFIGLKDAVRVNGATKLALNFIQYLDWKDAGIRGGFEALKRLTSKSRAFIERVEETANLPVVLIGTGPLHDDIIDLE